MKIIPVAIITVCLLTASVFGQGGIMASRFVLNDIEIAPPLWEWNGVYTSRSNEIWFTAGSFGGYGQTGESHIWEGYTIARHSSGYVDFVPMVVIDGTLSIRRLTTGVVRVSSWTNNFEDEIPAFTITDGNVEFHRTVIGAGDKNPWVSDGYRLSVPGFTIQTNEGFMVQGEYLLEDPPGVFSPSLFNLFGWDGSSPAVTLYTSFLAVGSDENGPVVYTAFAPSAGVPGVTIPVPLTVPSLVVTAGGISTTSRWRMSVDLATTNMIVEANTSTNETESWVTVSEFIFPLSE